MISNDTKNALFSESVKIKAILAKARQLERDAQFALSSIGMDTDEHLHIWGLFTSYERSALRRKDVE